MSHSLTVANFLLALEKENDWRTLGIFLDVEDCILDEIECLYESKGIRRCKEELFKVLKRRTKDPTWEDIAESLDNMRNHALAKEIREKYVILLSHHTSLKITSIDVNNSDIEVTPSSKFVDIVSRNVYSIEVEESTVRELQRLHSKFSLLVDNVREQLNAKSFLVENLRTYFRVHLQLEISNEITSINDVFETLYPYFCFIQYYCLEDLVDAFLEDCKSLKLSFKSYKKELEKFKKLASIKTLCSQIVQENARGTSDVHLKLIGFWCNVTIERFEKLVKYLIQKPGQLGRISVRDGCILISWVVLPNVLIEDLVTGLVYCKEFMSSVGIISLVVCGRVIFKSDVSQDTNITIENIFLKAVEVGSVDAVNLLLSVADININDQIHTDDQATAIFIASKNGHSVLVSALLEIGANPNIPRKDSTTSLVIASLNGHLEVVECLLKGGVDLDPQRESGATAVFCASQNGHTAIVSALLQYGANPNIPRKNGDTPLLIASFNGHLEVVECLLKAGVDLDARAEDDATAVYCGSWSGNFGIVSTLLKYGANPNIPRKNGDTPLMMASQEGHLDIVECLLKASVDLHAQAEDDATAVYFASQNGHTTIVAVLLEYGANPNIPLKDGSTPLMIASQEGHLDVVECLLKSGADFDVQADNGATSFFCASQNGHTAIVTALLKYGANPKMILLHL